MLVACCGGLVSCYLLLVSASVGAGEPSTPPESWWYVWGVVATDMRILRIRCDVY